MALAYSLNRPDDGSRLHVPCRVSLGEDDQQPSVINAGLSQPDEVSGVPRQHWCIMPLSEVPHLLIGKALLDRDDVVAAVPKSVQELFAPQILVNAQPHA